MMKGLIAKKIDYKAQGQRLKEKAIKLLINSGYGCFGYSYFDYQDPRVAELTTAFGRYTLKHLEKFVGKENVLYGDTDSLYIREENDAIVAEATSLGVKLEVDKRWQKLFLTPNKKQYFGLVNGELVYTTLTGLKNNQPAYFNRVTRSLIEICLEGADAVDYFRSQFTDLEGNLDELSYSQKSTKALHDYGSNGWQRQIYDEILEDYGTDLAQSKSQVGAVYRYWKIKGKGRSVTILPERYELNMTKYKEELFICVEPILQAYGVEEVELDRLW